MYFFLPIQVLLGETMHKLMENGHYTQNVPSQSIHVGTNSHSQNKHYRRTDSTSFQAYLTHRKMCREIKKNNDQVWEFLASSLLSFNKRNLLLSNASISKQAKVERSDKMQISQVSTAGSQEESLKLKVVVKIRLCFLEL